MCDFFSNQCPWFMNDTKAMWYVHFKVELYYNQPILFKSCASMIECSSPKRLSPWYYEGRPTLLYPQDFLSTQEADCLKAKKLVKKAENEQHNKMLIERTKLILTL